MMKLAAFPLPDPPTPTGIFGKINPIGPLTGDPIEEVGRLIGFGVNMFITLAAIFMLFYLLWGAFDWITSGGEKEKISKAQNKITNAVIGMLMIIGALTIFGVVTGNILGVVIIKNGQWIFNLPTLGGP